MKHPVSIVTALLLILSIPFAGSCASAGVKEENTTVLETSASVESTEQNQLYYDSLPDDLNFDGRSIVVLSRTETFDYNEIDVAEMNGDVVNDAVYIRGRAVEDRLNIVIDNSNAIADDSDMNAANTRLEKAVKAGSAEYDVVAAWALGLSASSLNGNLRNLYECEYLDLDNIYWSQGINESLSVGKGQYLCTGPMSLGYYRYMFVTMFNQNLFDNYNLDYPYDAVRNGTWTLDYQNELASQCYSDINGDSLKDAGDGYGFYTLTGTSTSLTDGYWATCDLRTTVKTEDNLYEYSVSVENFSTAIDKILALFGGSGSYTEKAGKLNDGDVYKKFTEGETAMTNIRLYNVETPIFRNMNDSYGILPMPKRDESQTDYYTLCQDQFIVYGIPSTVTHDDLGIMGAFLEALASESYKTVTPAYYEVALTTKFVNDADSVEMLNLVSQNVYIDPAVCYSGYYTVTVTGTLREALGKTDNTIASTLEKQNESMIKKIEKLNSTFTELQD